MRSVFESSFVSGRASDFHKVPLLLADRGAILRDDPAIQIHNLSESPGAGLSILLLG